MLRFTIRNLLVLVGIVAIGMAAMRDGSELTEHAVFSAVFLTLVIALVGAIVTRGGPRWVGFAVFGWIYAALAFVPIGGQNLDQHLLSTALIDRVLQPLLAIPHNPGVQPPPGAAPNMQGFGGGMGGMPAPPKPEQVAAWNSWFNARMAYQNRLAAVGDRYGHAQRIGQAIFTLMIAVFGAGVGQFLTRFRKTEASANPASSRNGTAASSQPHALVEH